jgi:hypothetical protein
MLSSTSAPCESVHRRRLFVPVLYAVSRHLVDRPPSWPSEMSITGPWLLRHIRSSSQHGSEERPEAVNVTKQWILATRARVPNVTLVYVTLGSMPHEARDGVLGVENLKLFLRLLKQVVCTWGETLPLINESSSSPSSSAQSTETTTTPSNQVALVVNACGSVELSLAWDEVNTDDSLGGQTSEVNDRLHIHRTASLDDMSVLGFADVVVHHGGAGTMAAACLNGVPQVVLPVLHDQHVNAKTVGWR